MEAVQSAAALPNSPDDAVQFFESSNARIAVMKQIGIKIRTKNSKTTHDAGRSFVDVLKSILDVGLDSDFDRHS